MTRPSASTAPGTRRCRALSPGGDGDAQPLGAQPYADVYAERDLWKAFMEGGVGDGKWHCYEIHIKMDTNGKDGVAQWWLDDRKVIERHDVRFGGHGGWQQIVIGSNRNSPANGRDMAIEFDDVAISRTGRIGPVPKRAAPPPAGGGAGAAI